MGKFGFGELELSIYKAIQKLGRASVRDIYNNFGSKGSYTTIMTVMSRMAEKGELSRESNGRQHIYWVNLPSKNILERIKEKIFDGKSSTMVNYLIDSDEKISKEELLEIEKLIQKKMGERKNG
jgi:BlaI family transcriptional regulator, penicillinase repressor